MIDYERLIAFCRERVGEEPYKGLVDLVEGVADWYQTYKNAEFPDWEGGYASGSVDALCMLAGVWDSHPDYPLSQANQG